MFSCNLKCSCLCNLSMRFCHHEINERGIEKGSLLLQPVALAWFLLYGFNGLNLLSTLVHVTFGKMSKHEVLCLSYTDDSVLLVNCFVLFPLNLHLVFRCH